MRGHAVRGHSCDACEAYTDMHLHSAASSPGVARTISIHATTFVLDVVTWGSARFGVPGAGVEDRSAMPIDGNGDSYQPSPVEVAGLEGVVQVLTGSVCTACVTREGKVFTWCSARFGVLGVWGHECHACRQGWRSLHRWRWRGWSEWCRSESKAEDILNKAAATKAEDERKALQKHVAELEAELAQVPTDDIFDEETGQKIGKRKRPQSRVRVDGPSLLSQAAEQQQRLVAVKKEKVEADADHLEEAVCSAMRACMH